MKLLGAILRPLAAVLLLQWGLGSSSAAAAGAGLPVPEAMQAITVQERLGASIDPELRFRDHQGQDVRLGDLLQGDKPVLLTLNYYGCATLCSIQLNGVVAGLRELDWTAGDEFRIVTVSIDPDDDVELARTKRLAYLDSYGRGESVDWHFLVGEQSQIEALAAQVGFGYRYDPVQDQYAHAAAVMLLAPDATVARYLYGVQYSARDLRFGLMEAAAGRVGSVADRLILSCFHYDAALGRYGVFAQGIMRLGGAVGVLVLASLGIVLWRQELFPKGKATGAAPTELTS